MALSLKNPSHKKGENEHKKKQFLKIEKSFKLLKNCIKFHKGPKSSVFLFSGFDLFVLWFLKLLTVFQIPDSTLDQNCFVWCYNKDFRR